MTFIPEQTIYVGAEPVTSIAFGAILVDLVKLGNTEIENFEENP